MPAPALDGARWSEIEEALRRSQTLAAAGQFASTIIHEINNPLEAISNLVYLVRQDAENPEKVNRYVGLLEEQLENVIHIVRQTLSFSRPLETLQAIDVAELAEAALRVHESKLTAKQIRLVKKLPPDAKVRAHPGELLQVVSNLVANAVEALPQKGTLCLRVRKTQKEIHMLVVDDGPGIPQAILSKVFDPFFSTKKERGTGLGLAITKSIVERHKGRIKTRSSVRQGRNGTAFRITLPLDRETAA